MKITIEENPKAAEPTYPCLMRAEDTIVLFTSSKIGAVVASGYWPVGRFDNDWKMDAFTPFTGSVTLSND